ncbi:glutathione S-transferase N-terminal domain-containing protein [Pseudoroseomonas sp. WGS1072]|uniref:glutathione S-transferase N-terminal domain-containing protein n=1 Tax=Roseomonas sp. WGS1072 TaxID=3366816 RepID=UPI003BF19885
MREQPVLYGASYSVYVRAVRLTLAEKGVPYTLVPVDVFAPGGPPAEYLARQPFGRHCQLGGPWPERGAWDKLAACRPTSPPIPATASQPRSSATPSGSIMSSA